MALKQFIPSQNTTIHKILIGAKIGPICYYAHMSKVTFLAIFMLEIGGKSEITSHYLLLLNLLTHIFPIRPIY